MEQEIVEEPEAQLPLDVPGDDTPAEPAVTEGDSAPSGDDSTAEPAKKDGVQKRIDELTKFGREQEREAAYYKGMYEASEAGKNIPPAETVTPEQPVIPAGIPAESDYDTTEEYKAAMTTYVNAQVDAGVQQGGQRITQEMTRAQKDAQRWAAIKTAAVDNPEINEVDYAKVQFTEDILNAAEGENFAIIAHDLGKNPVELARISALPLTQMVREIDKIGARLTAKPSPKTATTAPDPLEPVSMGGDSPEPKPITERSYEENEVMFEAARLKRLGVKQ